MPRASFRIGFGGAGLIFVSLTDFGDQLRSVT
jgi:hypothetical protein